MGSSFIPLEASCGDTIYIVSPLFDFAHTAFHVSTYSLVTSDIFKYSDMYHYSPLRQ
jgi:hypothetical protein